MLRRVLMLALALLCTVGVRAEVAAGRWSSVDVAPTRTSIYIGVVSMTMPRFTRHEQTYTTTYAANVIPFVFYNEKGTLTVDVSDDQLAALARGETIEFTGKAVNTEGEERKVTGKATPADASGGKLKVRVAVSKKIELIFNTTYRFH